MSAKILVAGLGNEFWGDAAFGIEVVRQLDARPRPDSVEVVDFGIRNGDLVYALLERYDGALLVDTCRSGCAPGTLYLLDADSSDDSKADDAAWAAPYRCDPSKMVRMLEALGGRCRRLLVLGCEPAELGGTWDGKVGLSAPVACAVGEAVGVVERVVQTLIADLREPNGHAFTPSRGLVEAT